MSALTANRQHPLKIKARMAAINGSTCGHGSGWGIGCGLLRSYRISHQNPYHFSFQRYYKKCVFGVHPVLNAPEFLDTYHTLLQSSSKAVHSCGSCFHCYPWTGHPITSFASMQVHEPTCDGGVHSYKIGMVPPFSQFPPPLRK